jgi:TRAP-type C4-dicarboxylate transport system permease small subunit
MPTDREKNLIISYLTLRRLIGILGLALPVVVVVGGFMQNGLVIQGSISGYYYTNMRDFFVGLLCLVALFLMSYKGYAKIDDVVAMMSGAFALGTIIFPMSMFSGKVVKVGIFLIDDNISQYLHLTFATLFFLSLSFNSLFLFTRHHPGVMGKAKKQRNVIYRLCGIVMIIAIVFAAVYMIFLTRTPISKMYPVLILETVALISFGISWLVKGGTLFKD